MNIKTFSRRAIILFALAQLIFMQHAGAQNACRAATAGMAHMQIARITLFDAEQQRVELRAHIADEPGERAAGYQHICPRVIDRTSILFVFDAPIATQFHMNNVHAPLDIGFFDEHGVLLQSMVMHPYSDGEEILYAPMRAFKYALESRVGFFAENNLLAGEARLLLKSLP